MALVAALYLAVHLVAWQAGAAAYRRLSFREKALTFMALAVLAAVILYKFSLIIASQFEEQTARLESVERVRQALPYHLATYAQLRSRKDAVEKAYRQVEISEGMLTYLESLLKKKDAIQQGSFVIDDGEPKKFAENYEQMPFLVKFSITNYKQLIDLLKDLTEGEKPMNIKSLTVNKIAGGRYLQVQLDLTGVRRVEQTAEG